MKKTLLIILLIGLILGGKYYIDTITINYEEIIHTSLSTYYLNGKTEELKPIITILEKNKKNDKLKQKIQTYSIEYLNNLTTYLNNKYTCNKETLNSCIAKVEELTIFNTKLKELYNYKCQDGFTIILPSENTNLSRNINDKIIEWNKIIKNPTSKNAKNSEEIRNEKCTFAESCDSCRDNLCTCTYINNTKKESVLCPNPNYNQ